MRTIRYPKDMMAMERDIPAAGEEGAEPSVSAAAMRRWFPAAGGTGRPAMRLICLPFAGGGVSAFAGLRAHARAHERLEVLPAQFPGRESRFSETPIASMPLLLARLIEALTPLLDRPYVLLGYSLGARVAYCLARAADRLGLPAPACVMVAAHRPPGAPPRMPPLHDLPSEEFWRRLSSYNGTPEEIVRNAEFRELFERTLRADFALAETSLPFPVERLTCPVVAFAGADDPLVSPREIAGWAAVAGDGFELVTIAGGHFFLRENADEFHAQVLAHMRLGNTRSETPV